jgi:hypothetical protein
MNFAMRTALRSCSIVRNVSWSGVLEPSGSARRGFVWPKGVSFACTRSRSNQ